MNSNNHLKYEIAVASVDMRKVQENKILNIKKIKIKKEISKRISINPFLEDVHAHLTGISCLQLNLNPIQLPLESVF